MLRPIGPGPGYRLAHTLTSDPGPTAVLPRYETWPIPIARVPGRTARAAATCGTCGLTLRYRLLSTGPTVALRALWAVLFAVFALCFAATMYYFLMGPADNTVRLPGALLFLGTLAAPVLAYSTGRQLLLETGLHGPGRLVGHKGHVLTPSPDRDIPD
ncbi:hypothetical protein NI17_017760 [Thermobifida halotolerans]|uniref:Uncharacterized protein n=1 Tax=Thermobifida halotolerans TaxID=483545 RepID=A0A399G1F4_9ACTN|nr:hypothetical protein [Thermobifida halotolerans]UOE18641.1 hypothetical protein NI17_017760 [Thermobifida halotolerans]